MNEAQRQAFREGLTEKLGADLANTLMDHLPPGGWSDLARRSDLGQLESRMDAGLGNLRVEMQAMESRFDSKLSDLRAYLSEYGWRSDGIYEVGDTTWREDPMIQLNTIQGYMRLGDEHDPRLSLERASARRDELVRNAR